MIVRNLANVPRCEQLECEIQDLERRRANITTWQVVLTLLILMTQVIVTVFFVEDTLKTWWIWMSLIFLTGIGTIAYGNRLSNKIFLKYWEQVNLARSEK